MSRKAPTAVVLLSGGLDSVVALAETLETQQVVITLTFWYGQRAWEQEFQASKAIADHYHLHHQVIELPWLAQLLPQEMAMSQRTDQTTPLTDIHRVWVPNRNGVFLNIAAAYAEYHQADSVVFGANADEATNFPDNTQLYRDRLTEALAYSTLNRVQVQTPMGQLSKAQIIDRGLELGVPLSKIWSCYEGQARHCGECPSCQLLKQALHQATHPQKERLEIAFTV